MIFSHAIPDYLGDLNSKIRYVPDSILASTMENNEITFGDDYNTTTVTVVAWIDFRFDDQSQLVYNEELYRDIVHDRVPLFFKYQRSRICILTNYDVMKRSARLPWERLNIRPEFRFNLSSDNFYIIGEA